MITCSYRGNFNSYFLFLCYKIIIKLGKLFFIQRIVLEILSYITKNSKITALNDYIRLLHEDNYHPDILKYPDNKLSELAKYEILDIYDLCRAEYPKEMQVNIKNGIRCMGITYAVEKSGFFSTIFTVTCISFYCLKNNIKLNIDWSNWEYSYAIDFLFSNSVSSDFYSIRSEGQGELFTSARNFLDSFQEGSETISEYLEYRHRVIKNLYDSIQLSDEDAINYSYSRKYVAAFIRRGDKLLNESYPIDKIQYSKKLMKYPNIVLLGDDYYFNKSLSRMIPGSSVFEIQGYKPRGGYLNNTGPNAVKSILCNFMILSNSNQLIGDPYCNLVAAALIYRKEFFSYELGLFPWKLRNYI